jgi:hypothetical protein
MSVAELLASHSQLEARVGRLEALAASQEGLIARLTAELAALQQQQQRRRAPAHAGTAVAAFPDAPSALGRAGGCMVAAASGSGPLPPLSSGSGGGGLLAATGGPSGDGSGVLVASHSGLGGGGAGGSGGPGFVASVGGEGGRTMWVCCDAAAHVCV